MYALNKLWRQYHTYIVSIGLIPLAFLVVVFGVYPAAKRTIALYGDLSVLNADITDIRKKLSQLQALDEQTLVGQLQLATSAVPTKKDLPTLFTAVERAAAETGVTLTEVAVTNPGSIATDSAKAKTQEEKKFGANLMPFTASVIGDYDQLISFFALTGRARRFLRARSFSFTFPQEGRPRVTINFDAFYTPLPPTIAGGESQIKAISPADEELLRSLADEPNLSELPLTATVPLTQDAAVLKSDPFAPF